VKLNPFNTKYVAWHDYALEHIGDGKQCKKHLLDAAFAEKREELSFSYISYLSPKIALDV
jgi:hypothetical protein